MNNYKAFFPTLLFFFTFLPIILYFNYRRNGVILEYFLYVGIIFAVISLIYIVFKIKKQRKIN